LKIKHIQGLRANVFLTSISLGHCSADAELLNPQHCRPCHLTVSAKQQVVASVGNVWRCAIDMNGF